MPSAAGTGRGARESADAEASPFVERLVDQVLYHPQMHVPHEGPRSNSGGGIAYRNRMTYSLRTGEPFGTHPLAVPEVNALAQWVHDWVRGSDCSAPPGLYDEMTVKLTRRGQLMLTLAIVRPVDEAAHEKWAADELPLLARKLRAAAPALASAAYWTCGRGLRGFRAPVGPFAEFPYTVFLGAQRLIEEVPIPPPSGALPYFLSHGTFSEINHSMEARIFPTVAAWCRRPVPVPPVPGSGGPPAAAASAALRLHDAELLVTGRDTNALALGLGTFCGPWAEIHAVSHCHLVVDDVRHNQREMYANLPLRPQQCDKARTAALIRQLGRPTTRSSSGGRGVGASASASTSADTSTWRPLVVVSSAGRHGLRADIIVRSPNSHLSLHPPRFSYSVYWATGRADRQYVVFGPYSCCCCRRRCATIHE